MAMWIRVADSRDGARVAEALLIAADVVRTQKPLLGRRYERIAEDLGDALDAVAGPNWDGDVSRPELDYRPPAPGDRDEVARRREIVERRTLHAVTGL